MVVRYLSVQTKTFDSESQSFVTKCCLFDSSWVVLRDKLLHFFRKEPNWCFLNGTPEPTLFFCIQVASLRRCALEPFKNRSQISSETFFMYSTRGLSLSYAGKRMFHSLHVVKLSERNINLKAIMFHT